MAARMSRESGLLSAQDLARITTLVGRMGLPVRVSGIAPETILANMRIDKKVQGGRIRLVLLRGVGASFVTADYDEDCLRRTLESQLQ